MFTNYYTLVAWGANPRPESGIFDTNLGRVGFEPTTPAMSRRYLNQAGPPALLGCSRVLA